MAGINGELKSLAEKFIDTKLANLPEFGVQTFTRESAVTTDGYAVELSQTKAVLIEETEVLGRLGLQAFASAEWFNDVKFMTSLNGDGNPFNYLDIHATYPIGFLVPNSTEGYHNNIRGTGKKAVWVDSYLNREGFGTAAGDMTYYYAFVKEGEHELTKINTRDNPDTLDLLNTRYQAYLQQLSDTDPTVRTNKAWGKPFLNISVPTGEIVNNLSIDGAQSFSVVSHGSSPLRREVFPFKDGTVGLILQRHGINVKNPYLYLTLTEDGPATIENFSFERPRLKRASQIMLDTVFELLELDIQ